MKTGKDIEKIWRPAATCADGYNAIADAWNEDVKSAEDHVLQTADAYRGKVRQLGAAKKQLRKVRSELARARKLCDYYSSELTAQEGFNSTLVCLIERIAKGNK